MIASRGFNLLKISVEACRSSRGNGSTNLRHVRLSHADCSYREIPPIEKKWVYAAEFFGGIMWWWVLWHFWHDFGHIVGEFPYPDASKWTDEELGIPPDNDDN